MNALDHYERQHTRRHEHAWHDRGNGSLICTVRSCGQIAWSGVWPKEVLSPPGLSEDYVRQVLAGGAAVGKAPRLPTNWRG